MRPRNTYQNKKLYALINELGIDDDHKKELVYAFTDQRTDRSSGMNYYECQAMIDHLQTRANTLKGIKAEDKKKSEEKCQKMRRKILSICHSLGWEKQDGTIDWDHLNDWLKKYGHKHYGRLNDYNEKELPKLVSQFENLLQSKYAKGKS